MNTDEMIGLRCEASAERSLKWLHPPVSRVVMRFDSSTSGISAATETFQMLRWSLSVEDDE